MQMSPALTTGNAEIDRHHVDFVEALNALEGASDEAVVGVLDNLISHCEAHFGFENEQMKASGFPPIGCHAGEHDMVLETVREIRKRAVAGQPGMARSLGPALSEWFENHVQSMDSILARFLADPGAFAAPAGEPAVGCSVPA